MPSDDIEKFLRVRPFQPFRITLTTRESYDVHHPELMMVGKRSLEIGITNDPTPRYDRAVTVSLLHVVRVEPLEAAKATSTGQ
jgi:hypothetical protein